MSTDVDDDAAEATAVTTSPGQPGTPGSSGGGSNEPNCTKRDGTRGYLRYEGLKYTTMKEQREVIRPEEQRPGVYLHVYCDDEWQRFDCFPEVPPAAQIDPVSLAESVRIVPKAPVLRTNPATGRHLVNLEAWFWAETWDGVEATATAGDVSVTVSAEPRALVVDPGDGSGPFTCTGPQPAYDSTKPARAQSSNCTHTYTRAGRYTATATIVYDVSFSSNVGVGGDLGTIEPDSTTSIVVHESQALVGG